MNYSKKDIIFGFAIIAILIIGVLYYMMTLRDKKINVSSPTPVSFEFKKEIEESFEYDIPENRNSIELKGDGRGLATTKEILADVENPAGGFFYQGWVEYNNKLTSLGKLTEGKGGWMLEFPEIPDTFGKKIVVSLEKDFDSIIEKRILEGSFK